MSHCSDRSPESSRRRKTRWQVRLVAFLFVTTVCAGLSELLARTYYALRSGSHKVELVEGPFGQPDERLGYRPRPGAHVHMRGPEFDFSYTITPQGLRQDEDVPYARQPGKRRILLAGDSFTMGEGVTNAERFGDLVAARLEDVEIVNMGVNGYGTDQQLLFYSEEGVKYAPDLVCLCYLTSHIRRNARATRQSGEGEKIVPKPKFELKNDELVLTNVPVPPVRQANEAELSKLRADSMRRGTVAIPFKSFFREHSAFYRLVHTRTIGLRKRHHTPYPEYAPDAEAWQLTCAIIREFARRVREQGSDFLLVLLPNKPFVLEDSIDDGAHEMLRDLAKQADLPVLDLLDPLTAAHKDGLAVYFPVDAHLSAEGHGVAADELVRVLEAKFGFRQRCEDDSAECDPSSGVEAN